MRFLNRPKHSHSKKHTNPSFGASVTEYILPTALICMVLLAAIFGFNLPEKIKQAVLATQKADMGGASGRDLLVSSLGELRPDEKPIDFSKPFEVCYKPSVCVTIKPNQIPADPNATNGTELMALIEAAKKQQGKKIDTPEEMDALAKELAKQAQKYMDTLELMAALCGADYEACNGKPSINSAKSMAVFFKQAVPEALELIAKAEMFKKTIENNPEICNTDEMAKVCQDYLKTAETVVLSTKEMLEAEQLQSESLEEIKTSVDSFCNTVDSENGCEEAS